MYDFKCGKCSVVVENIVDENEIPVCPVCDEAMYKLPHSFSINMGPVGSHGYYDDTLGAYVATNKQHKELCRQQGVTPKGDTPKPDGQSWV
jgi:hypothetical protein